MTKLSKPALAACALSWLLACAPAAAQLRTSPQVEITPFVGYQSSIDFTDHSTGTDLKLHDTNNAGVVLDFSVQPNSQVEVLYSRAKSKLEPDNGGAALTDLKVEYLHLGGLLLFGDGNVRPFFGGSLGLTRLSPDAPGLDDDTRFSMGLAGGVKLFLAKNVGLRLEARTFATEVSSNSAAFCSGGCRIYYDGSFIWQYSLNAGLIVGF